MGAGKLPVLRVGEWVRFDGDEHQVVALAGTSVRLRSRGGVAQVVLLAFLLAAADFELLDEQQAVPAMEPLGLLETLPHEVLERARRWERHLVEVVTGRAPEAPEGAGPRPGYDPAASTLKDRDAAKAVELSAAGWPTSARTVTRMRLRYAGVPGRPELTMVVDVATRTIAAAVLRPAGTKAVDAALLLARTLVPEPMRPGWSAALRMSASRLPHTRLLDIDARLETAAAKPVIVPETIVIDHGRVFVSEVFTRAPLPTRARTPPTPQPVATAGRTHRRQCQVDPDD